MDNNYHVMIYYQLVLLTMANLASANPTSLTLLNLVFLVAERGRLSIHHLTSEVNECNMQPGRDEGGGRGSQGLMAR